jgi:hypothetical protein
MSGLLCGLFLFTSAARAQIPPPVDIPIQNLTQQTQVWCWAAVAQQIILAARGPAATPPQCAMVALANNALPQQCCSGMNPNCIRTGSLEQIQLLIRNFGGSFSTQVPPTDPMTLYRTLASGRPIILHVRSGAMSSHVVVLRGMSFVPTQAGLMPVLHINDPLNFFTQPVPFSQLMASWINAIVIEPNWESPKMDSGSGDSVRNTSSLSESETSGEDDESCESDCHASYKECGSLILPSVRCEVQKAKAFLEECDDEGYSQEECKEQGRDQKSAWRSECKEEAKEARMSCREDKRACLHECRM